MPNNQTKPNQTQTRPVGARGGVNRSRVQVTADKSPSHGLEAAERSSDQLARGVRWAKANLPNESRTWAVGAFFAERASLGREPSSAEVVSRLRATGRDSGSIDPAVLAAEQRWCEVRGI